MGKTCRLWPLVLLAACAVAAPSFADDTAIQGIGGAIQPMAEYPSVVMEKMLVTIDLYSDHAEVDCTFVLCNTGAAASVRMGFPEYALAFGDMTVDTPVGFTHFRTWVDGEEVPTRIVEPNTVTEDPIAWWRWRVKHVRFAAGQARTVRVSYETEIAVQRASGDRLFRYTTSTGASWSGPIGFGHIRLNLHYGPYGGWFELRDPDFNRVGPGSFEWMRQNFEPSSGDYVDLIYHQPCVGIYVGRKHIHRGGPPRPYIKDGRLWAQVREVADWLGAELTVDGQQLTLLRGATMVAVRRGSRRARVGRNTILLPAAPRVERGRLMVPVSAIVRPFGAVVEFQARSKTVHIILPIHRHFLSILGPFDAGAALSAIPIGWAPPSTADYDPQVRRDVARPPRPWPLWMCTGWFDDDQMPEAALFLRKDDAVAIGLLEKISDGQVLFHWLEPWPEAGKPVSTVLSTRPRGAIEYRKQDGATGRLDLTHTSIEAIPLADVAAVYYWDDEGGRYRKVQTAD